MALAQAELGLWGIASPRSLYDHYPGFAHHWISALGPYNEHLIRDFAAAELGFAVMLVCAAIWFERRLVDDAALAALIAKPTIEIFVLYVRGVPAGFFELDTAALRETKLCYFGLIPDFIGRRLGPYLLQAAIDQAWSRPLDRFWLHTSTFDHPGALATYQRAGFVVYARRRVSFDDPRDLGILPKTEQS